eukprot:c19095_g1_i1 orf=12-398(-)
MSGSEMCQGHTSPQESVVDAFPFLLSDPRAAFGAFQELVKAWQMVLVKQDKLGCWHHRALGFGFRDRCLIGSQQVIPCSREVFCRRLLIILGLASFFVALGLSYYRCNGGAAYWWSCRLLSLLPAGFW